MSKRQNVKMSTNIICHVTVIVTFGLWALAIPKGWSLRDLLGLRGLRDRIFCLQGMRVKTYSHVNHVNHVNRVNSFYFVPNLLSQAEIGILPFGIDMAKSQDATLAVTRQMISAYVLTF